MNWSQLSVEKTFALLSSSPNGLSMDIAEERLLTHGPNLLTEKKKTTPWLLLLSQFSDLMIVVLLAAALISGLLGELTDAIVILVIVVLNAVVGFVQEYRAEKAMQALKRLAVATVRVLRNRQELALTAAQLAPGDVVLLQAGDAVPADLRILESVNLLVEEAALTGESQPAEKTTAVIEGDNAAPGDQKNMAFKGTFVVRGHGKGVVVATGMQTELGRIAHLLQEKEPATPLQQRLLAFSKKLAVIVLLLSLIFFAAGWLRGENLLQMVLTSISLAVAAIPEALPAIITISLALAAKRMIRVRSLVRKLPAVETLGSVTCICTDKTGTLTRNQMHVEQVFVHNELLAAPALLELADNPTVRLLTEAMLLNNDAVENKDGLLQGDGTETALLSFGRELYEGGPLPVRLAEIAFDAERKLMTTFHAYGNRFIAFTKGAPDVLLQRCTGYLPGEVTKYLDEMAEAGERILGFACREWDALPATPDAAACEYDLHFLGLVGLADPPREETADAIEQCKQAGILPVMITGDHPTTARTIAQRVGIINNRKDLVVTGKQLAAFDDADFLEKVEKIRVYARVSPEQKLQIVKTLQKKGHIVAMTGDGVNDAPSLHRADIGIAMGITGTDVAKEAADMVLQDDHFATIVKAVGEGRRVYDNILKFIQYLLTSNAGELWTLLLGPLLGLPIALLPIHILWINLVSDGLPALALSFQPAAPDILRRPPRPPQQSIFDEGRGVQIIWAGLLMAGSALATQAFAIREEMHWQTIVFNVLCLSQMGNVLSISAGQRPFLKAGVLSNPWLLGSVLLTCLLQAALTYIPVLQTIFHTQPLGVMEILVVSVGSGGMFVVMELVKVLSLLRSN